VEFGSKIQEDPLKFIRKLDPWTINCLTNCCDKVVLWKRLKWCWVQSFAEDARDGEPSDAFPSESNPITVKATETFLRFMNAKFIWDFHVASQICD
jgi:hypothetical protein